jgi:hypothetical protein
MATSCFHFVQPQVIDAVFLPPPFITIHNALTVMGQAGQIIHNLILLGY